MCLERGQLPLWLVLWKFWMGRRTDNRQQMSSRVYTIFTPSNSNCLLRKYTYISLIYRWGNWSLKGLSLTFTLLISNNRIQVHISSIQVFFPSKHYLCKAISHVEWDRDTARPFTLAWCIQHHIHKITSHEIIQLQEETWEIIKFRCLNYKCDDGTQREKEVLKLMQREDSRCTKIPLSWLLLQVLWTTPITLYPVTSK